MNKCFRENKVAMKRTFSGLIPFLFLKYPISVEKYIEYSKAPSVKYTDWSMIIYINRIFL